MNDIRMLSEILLFLSISVSATAQNKRGIRAWGCRDSSFFVYICQDLPSEWQQMGCLLIIFLLYMLLVFGEFALSDVCQAVMLVMLGEVETHLFALC